MLRAAREYERDLAAGLDPEPSDEVTAGEILQAELAADIHELLVIARAWREGQR